MSLIAKYDNHSRILDSRHSPKMERRSTVRDPVPGGDTPRLTPGFQPDNSCCFCLSLKSGTAIISILHSLFYLGLIIWSVELFINQSARDTLALTEREGGREGGREERNTN